ncbi:hypothetical protein WMF11_31000 [Sorangium sp. So ce295]|uniref:hypothetical protein n=1 Tax=Sorangium sp. So ce295 TaxID=3133295 RepID=UPI003F6331DF
MVIIESGPEADPIAHARLRRDTVHLWTLEIATHADRWDKSSSRFGKDAPARTPEAAGEAAACSLG